VERNNGRSFKLNNLPIGVQPNRSRQKAESRVLPRIFLALGRVEQAGRFSKLESDKSRLKRLAAGIAGKNGVF